MKMDVLKLIQRDIDGFSEYDYWNYAEAFKTLILAKKEIEELRGKVNNGALDDVTQQSELFEIIADRLEKELPFELETIKRETLIKIISNCG